MRGGSGYVRAHPQLAMTLLLMVIVPVAFLVSGQQFLNAARENQERLEKDRIGMMNDVFASYMRAVNFDPALMQSEMMTIAEQNSDITKFRVAKEAGKDLVIVAALDTESVGAAPTDPDHVRYRLSPTDSNEGIIGAYAHKGTRYWQSFRLVRTDTGENYYIFVESSLAYIDALFASRIVDAYYWLIGLIAVVLFLIFRHVRLIDYAYLYQETRKANEMKDLFTNMIAHELRAPLTAMRGYASMIRERTDISDDVRAQALRIEDAAGRLVVIVSDLLDVARIQSGRLSIEPAEVALPSLITSVLDALQVSAKEKGIIMQSEGMHGDTKIIGDGKRLHQALTNVVSNAIKYTREGTITVSLEERADRVEIRVKDTGMGIASEDQKKLFAPFFRVSSSEVSSITGTGLGMWITKQLIELMKGSIGIESIKGVGTHVVITLPKR